MQFASVGSGSEGNALLVRSENTLLLVDCGFSLKELILRMQRIGVEPSQIDAILLTHEHADHVRGVGPLARRYLTPVYMTKGTASSRALGKITQVNFIEGGNEYVIGDIQVNAHKVPHDAREPVQFTFVHKEKQLGVLTDVGCIPEELAEHYCQVQGLVLEANHDPEMLARGPYPLSLKQRVGGHWGHLSNQQCASMVEHLCLARLQHLVIAHVSQKNNSHECVLSALGHLRGIKKVLTIANQERGFDWLHIS